MFKKFQALGKAIKSIKPNVPNNRNRKKNKRSKACYTEIKSWKSKIRSNYF